MARLRPAHKDGWLNFEVKLEGRLGAVALALMVAVVTAKLWWLSPAVFAVAAAAPVAWMIYRYKTAGDTSFKDDVVVNNWGWAVIGAAGVGALLLGLPFPPLL